MIFLKTIIITNFIVFIFQHSILYLVTKPYAESYLNGALIFNPKIDRMKLFIHLSIFAISIVLFTSLFKLKTPYGLLDITNISLVTLLNGFLLVMMWWCYRKDDELFKIEKVKTIPFKNHFVNEELFKKTINLLIENEIISQNHYWLNKRKKDIAILLVKLEELKIIRINNKSYIHESAKIFFSKKFTNSEISSFKGDLLKNGLKPKDKETYLRFDFLNNINE